MKEGSAAVDELIAARSDFRSAFEAHAGATIEKVIINQGEFLDGLGIKLQALVGALGELRVRDLDVGILCVFLDAHSVLANVGHDDVTDCHVRAFNMDSVGSVLNKAVPERGARRELEDGRHGLGLAARTTASPPVSGTIAVKDPIHSQCLVDLHEPVTRWLSERRLSVHGCNAADQDEKGA